MTRSTKNLIVGAAIAGLVSGSVARIHANTEPSTAGKNAIQSSTLADDKNSCKGKNTCKGKGGCKSGNNGCKGKNDCKGKGGCATDGSHNH